MLTCVNSTPILKLYFTVAEVASCAGVKEVEIQDAIEYGELRVFDYLGGNARISRKALEAWLRKRIDLGSSPSSRVGH